MRVNVYQDYAHERGLTISKARAQCVHTVAGMKCPQYPSLCAVSPRLMDHRYMFRYGHEKVLLAEPYLSGTDAMINDARSLSDVLGLWFAVGEPGAGPRGGMRGDQGLIPFAFAHSQALADLAVGPPPINAQTPLPRAATQSSRR